MHSIDEVRRAQARLIELLERHGADLPIRVVVLLSSASDHLLDAIARPDLAGRGDRQPPDPRSEIGEVAATLRQVLPLMGDRNAIAVGLALRDLSAAEALWMRL